LQWQVGVLATRAIPSLAVPEAIRLTEALLEDLAAQWRKHDAPIARRLAPGLSDAEMDALAAPLGLGVPPEARAWWGWHNGAQNASVVTSDGKTFSSLERCVSPAPTT
jgi:cell wall assembly regulator SMI1